MQCRPKALEKSKAITFTYGFVCNMSVRVCTRCIGAAVVELEGLKEGKLVREEMFKLGLVENRIDDKLMNSFSINLDRTGVTEIGLKSWHVLGCGTFGTGVIELDFHLDNMMWNDTIVTKKC